MTVGSDGVPSGAPRSKAMPSKSLVGFPQNTPTPIFRALQRRQVLKIEQSDLAGPKLQTAHVLRSLSLSRAQPPASCEEGI